MKTFNHLPFPKNFNPAVQISNDELEGPRLYKTPEGLIFPSITTILQVNKSDAIDKWKKRIGEEAAEKEKNRAAERGNDIHEMVERYLKNEPATFFVNKFSSFQRSMFNQLKPKLNKIDNILLQEKGLYSKHFKIAGRCDCVADYDKVFSIIDFKGSTKIKKEKWLDNYFMQGSFYAYCIFEMLNIRIPQIVILVTNEMGGSQAFIEKPMKWWKQLEGVRKQYEEIYGI